MCVKSFRDTRSPCFSKNEKVFALGVMLLLVGVVALASSACMSMAEERFSQEVAVDKGTELQVETQNGQVVVEVGGEGKVRVGGKKRVRALTGASGMLGDIKIKVEKKEGKLQVGAEHPKSSFTENYSVSFALSVPRATPLRLLSRNGSIRVEGTKGRIWVETRNGSVKLRKVEGNVEVTTKNGSVKVSGRIPAMKLTTRNGSIKASSSSSSSASSSSGSKGAALGRISLNTNNGSIRYRGKASQLRVKSRNGSVKVQLEEGSKLSSDGIVKTKNGSVKVTLPKSFSCALEAKTSNGRIRSDFDLESKGKKRISGTLGQGGAKLSIETRNGSIRLQKR